ncbi:GNAT family N-acetyltransferase [Glycomyces sp. TRM65418]|uniref:GNAT family N-acetyltransferase n=1 Tax=Glycomyces sp. TRM65418 TaxID=2867006 RepID=UPI001CE58695|nr:GNAT family protein [Glycomyces sp. TRM65418]MCC3765849.1 GNAT family N-acetyltransferase [Glycomyces sp. TRM65418]QZD55434.1 GNAT family N-acetyltransferase [Glycomyces sp. TRM65418]
MFEASLGEGVELRPLVPELAEEFAAHMDRGREYIGRYVAMPDVVSDLPAARKFLKTYAEKTAADTGRIWGIWLDGTLVGGVLFRVMDLRMESAEAGCWLEPAAVGKGLVTRAVTAIIDWAIEERGVHRVDWYASSRNEASLAVARRLGMTKEGTLRAAYLHRGERYDMEVWSVLAPEWRAARRS